MHEGDEAQVGAVVSDISVIAVAAPGDEPQIAVVPGKTRERVSSQPSSEAAAIVDRTPIRKIGHSAAISAQIDRGRIAGDHDADDALGERRRPARGMWTAPPLAASRTAATIGPSSSAAGSCIAASAAANSSDRTISAAHRSDAGHASGRPSTDLGRAIVTSANLDRWM